MAMLVTTDNRPIFLDSETASLLWLVKTGERKGTPKTLAKVKQIKKWYLNRHNAPHSYLQQNPHLLTVDRSGNKVNQVRLPYID